MRWSARAIRHAALGALLCTTPAAAQGHGPIYGLSTPTLGRGGWSLDVGAMSRLLDGTGALMLRPMLSHGLTQDLQASASVPIPLRSSDTAPAVRGWTRMPAVPDVELLLGWRFHRNGLGIGARWESTLWAGIELPTDSERSAVGTSPGLFISAVTGYASRTVYAWLGAGYRRYAGSGGSEENRVGDAAVVSVVLGWRPPTFRRDYPHPDWRVLIEMVGERIGNDVVGGERLTDTGGDQLFIGPTVLGLYGSWGISGGPVFPIHQSWNGNQLRDTVRFAVNVTFWR